MKKLFAVIVLALIATGLKAQESKKAMPQAASKSSMTHNMKDCVMMTNGKMMMMKGGKTMPMTSEMKMENGAMVNMDGTVMMPDGNKMMMKNGDCMDMKGMMMKMDKNAKSQMMPASDKKQAEMKSE